MNMKTQPSQSRRRILFWILGLLAFSIPQIPAATPVPENVEWVLVELNGKAYEAPAGRKGSGATLKLDASKVSANGVSFVNRYGGKYELKDNTLKFGQMMTTRMASTDPELNRAEHDFHAMLKDVTGWRITEGKLELLAGDKVVMKFSEKAEVQK